MIDPFVYRPPTPITAPRYAHLRKLEAGALNTLRTVCEPVVERGAIMTEVGPNATPADYAAVNDACKALYDGILAVCPPGADRDRAEADVRLARMRANEAMAQSAGPSSLITTLRIAMNAEKALRNARMWACAAIAPADEAALPAWEGG